MGCHFLLWGIFPTQGSNPRLLHWQTDSLPVHHLGSPVLLSWSETLSFLPAIWIWPSIHSSPLCPTFSMKLSPASPSLALAAQAIKPLQHVWSALQSWELENKASINCTDARQTHSTHSENICSTQLLLVFSKVFMRFPPVGGERLGSREPAPVSPWTLAGSSAATDEVFYLDKQGRKTSYKTLLAHNHVSLLLLRGPIPQSSSLGLCIFTRSGI